MDTTLRTRMLATLSMASLLGVLTATGMTSLAAGEEAPGDERVTDSGCQTPDPASAAETTSRWFGPTMYAAE